MIGMVQVSVRWMELLVECKNFRKCVSHLLGSHGRSWVNSSIGYSCVNLVSLDCGMEYGAKGGVAVKAY